MNRVVRAGRARRNGNRTASVLFLVGCLAVLGGTFMLGVMAGRFWPRPPSSQGPTAARGAKEASPARTGDRAARQTEPAPTLTFYQDLTAPLTAPPPVKPSKPPRVEKSDKLEAAPKTEGTAAAEIPRPAPNQAAFTVQVGAYKAREPAEALRARLAAGGHDAYVVQIDAPGSVRFRVRVGSFATRDAAQQVADRIGTERSLSAFVTSR
ncbi:MAG TPA: SPOR domain-containing protein [Candidatus Binatia bacterium]|nr:SPOR domain-containing protein [Candidatus Binatia bacterium]